MLAGPIERDFSISRSLSQQSRQRKKSFLSRQVLPSRSAQPSGRTWGRIRECNSVHLYFTHCLIPIYFERAFVYSIRMNGKT